MKSSSPASAQALDEVIVLGIRRQEVLFFAHERLKRFSYGKVEQRLVKILLTLSAKIGEVVMKGVV